MKKQLNKLNPLQGTFQSFMGEFVTESDRAAVILGAAKVEFQLGQILEKYLLPSTSSSDDLLEGDSPLATFSAKIKICHRLGLIDNNFVRLLNIFRKLRNGFAHEVTSNSLSSGSARDRVFSMAEQFHDKKFYISLLNKISEVMNKDASDPSVVFRATLGVSLLHLNELHIQLTTITPKKLNGIIEFCTNSIPPEDKQSKTQISTP